MVLKTFFVGMFLSVMVFSGLKAQQATVKIQGQVVEESGKAIPSLKVLLSAAQDTITKQRLLTDENGNFSFEGLPLGSYRVHIKSIHFEPYSSAVLTLSAATPTINVSAIRLIAISNNLNEVQVTSKKSFVEQKMDRTVVNVDAVIANAGTTALDVLAKSPGVYIDANGLISLKGRAGTTVFIDDKPTYLSGAELESYLRSLPASSLDQIELMTNPPAKYDAAGNAGIINIKTKKSKAAGFNGNLSTSVTQGELTRSNNSLNLNFRKNKINVFGNFSYTLNNSFTKLDLNRTYKNADDSPKYYFDQFTYFRRHGDTFNAKVGVDFYQTAQTTWGMVVSGTATGSSQLNYNTSNLLNTAKQPDSVIEARNRDLSRFRNLGLNFNYRHKLNAEGGDITVDVDYLSYNYQVDQSYYNTSYFADQSVKYQDQLTGDLPSAIHIYTAKTDYVKPLSKTLKFSTGLKTGYISTDNTANYLYTTMFKTVVDYEKTNRFRYKENISSAYVNLSMEGKLLSLQAGLRYENTISDGHQLGNEVRRDSAFRRSYNSFFPTFYVSYKLDTNSNHQLGLNYGRRIDRPFYRQLNPYYSPLDKFTYYVGNPFLKPSFTQQLQFSHTYKNKVTTSIGYSWTKDEVRETIQIVDGTYYSRPGNIGRGTVASVSVNADLDLTKWLTTHLYFEYNRIVSKTDFYTGYFETKGNFFRTSPNVQIKLSPSWNAEVNYSYLSKISSVQFVIGDVSELGAAVQKKLSTKSNLKLAVTDIFRDRVVVGAINNLSAAEAGWINRSDSRSVILTYSYRFGKAFATPKKYDSSGADAEKRRAGS